MLVCDHVIQANLVIAPFRSHSHSIEALLSSFEMKYTLTYFDAKGRAEISRLIFAAANVEYIDDRVTDWPEGKDQAPLGQMPYLTIDGSIKIPQSMAIARYLAR